MRFLSPSRRLPVRAVLISLVLGTTRPPSEILAQDTKTVSATMLKVLGEAADGARTAQPVFFVADYRFPHQVVGPFDSLAQAQRVQTDSGTNFGIFGPYTTRKDPAPSGGSRIIGITITVARGAHRDTLTVDPQKVDALFFSAAAIDKFVIPYYGRTYGSEYAQKLRTRLAPLGIILCHIKPSYICMPAAHGGLELIQVMQPTTTTTTPH